MTTITKEALEWIQDEMESKDAIISDLEDELESVLEDVSTLKAQLARMMATLQTEYLRRQSTTYYYQRGIFCA